MQCWHKQYRSQHNMEMENVLKKYFKVSIEAVLLLLLSLWGFFNMLNLLTTVIHRYLYEDLLDMNFFFFFFIKNNRKWTFEVNNNNDNNNTYFAHVMRILSYNTLHVIRRHHSICTIRYTFSSNNNIHKSSCSLYFWASDPVIGSFY